MRIFQTAVGWGCIILGAAGYFGSSFHGKSIDAVFLASVALIVAGGAYLMHTASGGRQ